MAANACNCKNLIITGFMPLRLELQIINLSIWLIICSCQVIKTDPILFLYNQYGMCNTISLGWYKKDKKLRELLALSYIIYIRHYNIYWFLPRFILRRYDIRNKKLFFVTNLCCHKKICCKKVIVTIFFAVSLNLS